MKILITGGSSDIAKAILSYQSLNSTNELYFTSSTPESLKKTLLAYKNLNVNAKGLLFNFHKPVLEDVKFDAVVLNAASVVKKIKPLHELGDIAFQSQIQGDLLGNIYLLKQILPSMMANKFGRIVFISSISTCTGTSGYAPYIAAKGAMESLIRNIAVDYSKYNILANSLRLGVFKTTRNRFIWKRKPYQEYISKIVLQKRMGESENVKKIVDYLLSQDLYTTGESFNIAGGLPLVNFGDII